MTAHQPDALASTPVRDTAAWGMIGQEHAIASLRRAIRDDHLSHAYLFSGPRGVGRATLARRLAQALCCEARVGEDALDPCLECRPCRQIEAGSWPDVEHITIGGICDERDHKDHVADGSTRLRVCQVRRLERVATVSPLRSPYRVFIIDAADDLQTEAAHALLKTLEEPPSTALLLLTAGDVQELLPTIRSRCQELTLRPLPVARLAQALIEGGVAPGAATEAATLSGGRYGLARQMLSDPSLAVLRETTAADIERLVAAGRNERFDYASTLGRRWSRERESVLATLDGWRDWWRHALHASVETGSAGGAGGPWTPREAVRALAAVQTAREHLLDNTNPQLALEVMLLDVPRARMGAVPTNADREEARPA
ncbi:MAG: DNA polymerase III subunit delta' [Dehalococcoidia bacterium]|nr:DNA polymerase III subunit delta' [Dehalococcoidia bacterium]